MATQQRLIAETVTGLKKALKRKPYESDSDSPIDHDCNRGQKLKKRARFNHQGQAAPQAGPESYKETVEIGGVRRQIISRNPQLVDENGYELDSDDDEDRIRDAFAVSAELDPYANIRLENILGPLTAITDLPTHQTLSRPFLSQTLTTLANQSSALMRKENRSLWEAKGLMTRFCGDLAWAPCGLMLGHRDIDPYSDNFLARQLVRESRPSRSTSPATDKLSSAALCQNFTPAANTDVGRDPSYPNSPGPTIGRNESDDRPGQSLRTEPAYQKMDMLGLRDEDSACPVVESIMREVHTSAAQNGVKIQLYLSPRGMENDGGGGGGENHSTRLNGNLMPSLNAQSATETRAEHNDSRVSLMSASVDAIFIHPIFLPPPNAQPDRDDGLPEQEAADVRRLLALYVQKQEEVCRGARRLNEGLLRADRLRKEVLKWAKAEAHCGLNRDMSDGEDWYDKEEWGLVDNLKKGQDEEDEEAGTTAKKTRARR